MRSGPQPFASVIVPAYRAEHFLGDCLVSVRDQSFTDFECIVVDDASPDSDSMIAEQFAAADDRFRRIRHLTNKGVSAARNTGLAAARGKFVLFLDADDVLLPNALATQHMLAVRHKVDAVWTTGEFWHGGKRIHRYYFGEAAGFSAFAANAGEKLQENSLRLYRFSAPNGCLLVRRKVLSTHSIMFDHELVRGEDVEFAVRALRACRSAAVAPLVTFLYRRGHESASFVQHRPPEHWRSLGQFFRKISDRNADWPEFRLLIALRHLGSIARHIATFRGQLPSDVTLKVVSDIATAYRGIDPAIFDRTASHPGDVPSEWDPCFRPLFEAFVRQDAGAALRCVDELSRTVLRGELVEASRLRAAGYFRDADKIVTSAYQRDPHHPEIAVEYGRVLLREKDNREAALELFQYGFSHSVRVLEPTGALSWALAGSKRVPDAIGVVRQSLKHLPHSPTLFDLLAKFCDRAGEREERLSALRLACRYAPKDPLRRERLIECLLECGKEPVAREEIDCFAHWMGQEWRERMLSVVERNRGALVAARERVGLLVQHTHQCDLRALSLQGDILLDLGEYAAAIQPLEILSYHEQNSAVQRIKLATAARKAGQYERALGVLNEIAEYLDRDIDESIADLFGNVSAADAIAFLTARRDHLARAPSLLARLWKTAMDTTQADALAPGIGELMQLGIDRNPSSPVWRLIQIEFLLSRRKSSEALEMARALCAIFPREARSHMALARCLAATQCFAEAAEAGRVACALEPENAQYARTTDRFTMKAQKATGTPKVAPLL